MRRQKQHRWSTGLNLTLAGAVFLAPAIVFAVAYDYNMVTVFGSTVHSPETGSSCNNQGDAGLWLQGMTNTWVTTINSWGAYQGSNALTTKDAMMSQLCNSSRSYSWCADGQSGGINTQKAALLALHGVSYPVAIPTTPTFRIYPASYLTNATCYTDVFSASRLGLPTMKYLMMLSCDSLNQASDLPSGSDQLSGWIATANSLHVATGFSGNHNTHSDSQTMSDFLWDQGYQGLASAWMNHFTTYDGTNSACATAAVFGANYTAASGRWGETLVSNTANTATNVAIIGYYCNCCADYDGAQGVHCTSTC